MAYQVLFAVIVAVLYIWVKGKSRKHPPLPPGPPALPLVGHLLSIPSTRQDTVFYSWGKQYGNVIHLHTLGKSWIVLNSIKAAIDLLDKRSYNYSDRPYFPVYELMGWVPDLLILPYGKRFQLHRKLMKQYLDSKECVAYRPIQAREAHVLVQNLVSNPAGRDGYIARFSTAIVMRIAFGHKVESDDDPYLQIAEGASHAVTNSGSPGGSLVDFFPVLQHLPSWFPGVYWANYARKHRAIVRKLHEIPFLDVQEQIAKGKATPSFLTSQLETFNRDEAENHTTAEDIQGVAGSIYFAGAETTWSSLSIFFLAMVLYPECQARAQEEIDTVIGPGRLPEFNDRNSLPYMECILQETLRWNHATPLGFPHRSLEDDIYEGMFIPKGSIVIANTRGMTLDQSVYADPLKFNPIRYLPKPEGNGEPYPISHFGFGRRICPGRYLADASLWIVISSVLATLTISKTVGKNGEEVTPEVKFTDGITSHPFPFQCDIRPRNRTAQSLIAQADTSDYY